MIRQDPAPPSEPRRKPRPLSDEPQLTKELEKYCDLRRRGFSHNGIRNRTGWPSHYPDLFLEEAGRRGMPGSNENANEAFREWLLESFDSAMDITAICRLSAQPEHKTRKKLKEALDADSGKSPDSLIVPGPDGHPSRVSWTTPDGQLHHRSFDGPFPPGYPNSDAVTQCRQVLIELMATSSDHDRAYTMLLMAEAGLHAFDHDNGRQLYNVFADAGMDDDAKRTVLLNLHEHPGVGQLLLDRCGISPRWLTTSGARSLSRRLRQYEFAPALVRAVVEFAGHNPNAYYVIGPDYRIPKPEPEELEKCTEALRQAGGDDDRIEAALATLGVPPVGH